LCPSRQSRTGWRRRGKKAVGQVERSYLDQALENFSGYITADELYDGPWCVLSIVDNHTFKRLTCCIVDKKVTQPNIVEFFTQFQQALDQRGLKLAGITTDGSNLYPAAIPEVFGQIPHQVCHFHVVSAIAKGAREAAVHLYKQRVAKLPKLKSGRPHLGREQEKAARVRAEKEQLLELYRHRYTLVARTPDPTKLEELLKLLQPYPEITTVRDIMQDIYGLYDCGTRGIALAKLAGIRQQATQLQDQKSMSALLSALNGPCIEKSLVFLDHPGLPSTSNAVERGNRRHRKMQKSVYRVRSKRQLQRRLALDLLREQRALGREECVMALREWREAA
jgi:hypothetical protein